MVGNSVNGYINGEYKEYHENGQLKKTYNYVNGYINGKYKLNYDEGQLNDICNFVDGKKWRM